MSPFGPEFLAPGTEPELTPSAVTRTAPYEPGDQAAEPELAQEVNGDMSGAEPELVGAAVAVDGPEPMLAGTFAIYQDGQGGFVLVTDTPAMGTQRKHIPAGIVKLVTGGGLVGRKFAGIFG